VVSSALGLIHRPRQVRELDHFHYIAMAEAPPGRAEDPRAAERPFCYRILVPALVQQIVAVSGLGLNTVFWGTSQLALVAFLFTLFALLRGLGFGIDAALLGVALTALTPGAVRWYAYQYWMPDPLCLWLVTLALLLARHERFARVGFVAFGAALTRESWVLIPAFATLLWMRRRGSRSLVQALLVFAPAAAAMLAVRLSIVPGSGPTLLEASREMLAFRVRHLLDNQLYFATVGSFGVLVPLLALRAKRAWDAARARPEDAALVLLAYGSLAFANNTDRLLVYALPALLPPALRAVEAVSERVGRVVAIGAALVVQAWFYAITPGWGISGLSVYQPIRWSVVVLCLVILGAGVAALRRKHSYSS
jgi:hypothetical protein